MLDLKTYIVSLRNREDLDDFYEDMESPGGRLYIPSRRVEVSERREISRNTHYRLTEQEANLLRQDPRVLNVELHPDELGIIVEPSWTQENFTYYSGSLSKDDKRINWGLHRTIENADSSSYTSGVRDTLSLKAEGRNVDVVVVDGHADPTHPEFAVNSDGTGGSRVIQYNWFAPYGRVYNYGGGYTGDNTHGHHVMGTIGGNRQGFARRSNLYNISIFGATGTGVNSANFLDYIRQWHNVNKPVNPDTGRKNPTIVANSWSSGFTKSHSQIRTVYYRGTTYNAPPEGWTSSSFNNWDDVKVVRWGSTLYLPYRSNSIILDVEDAVNDGILIVNANGNYSAYYDNENGPDWDNYVILDDGFYYFYNRPHSINANQKTITVGNITYQRSSSKYEKSASSSWGPRIDIWAPGTNILSAHISNFSSLGASSSTYTTDYRNSNYIIGYYTGTSMASPHVTGILACALELYPDWTQSDARTYLQNAQDKNLLYRPSSSSTDYLKSSIDPQSDKGILFAPDDIKTLDGGFLDPPAGVYSITPTAYILSEVTGYTSPITFSFTVSAENIPLNTTLHYRIVSVTGTVDRYDFQDLTDSADFIWTGIDQTFTKTIRADRLTEGTEQFKIQLLYGGADGNVVDETDPISIYDTSKNPSYSVTPSVSVVEEGDTITFTVESNVEEDETLNYIIKNYSTETGINELDFADGKLTDDFAVFSGLGQFAKTLSEDRTTENTQTFVVEIRTIVEGGYQTVATSSPIDILDTSLNGVFTVSVNKTSFSEGENLILTINGSDLTPSYTYNIYWQIEDITIAPATASFPEIFTANDFDDTTSGLITLNVRSDRTAVASIIRGITNDKTTDGEKKFRIVLREANAAGPVLAISNTITVLDTSQSPTYKITPNVLGVNEGESVRFTITTSDVQDGTIIYWRTIPSTGLTEADFDDVILSGAVVISNNTATLTRTIRADYTAEGPESFAIELRSESLAGSVLATSVDIEITDTSIVPDYRLEVDQSFIDEGATITFTITAVSAVPDNTLVPWAISGSGISLLDISNLPQLTGNFNIINNTASLTVRIKADEVTEGTETLYLSLTGPDRSEIIGVQIRDTSRTPGQIVEQVKFYITATSQTIDEGEKVFFLIRAEGLTNDVIIPYKLLGITSDSYSTPGIDDGTIRVDKEGTIRNLTLGSGFDSIVYRTPFPVNAVLEVGVIEDFKRTGSRSIFMNLYPDFPFLLVVTQTITILDTTIETDPEYALVPDNLRVFEGSNVRIDLYTNNVDDGEVITAEILSLGDSVITVADFVGVNDLSNIQFPPLVGGKAYVVLDIADDFIFEQSEYFYMAIPNTYAATPPIEIIDSGNTILSSNAIFSGNATISILDKAKLEPNIGGLTIGQSYWKGISGKISEKVYVQGRTYTADEDSPIFYQPFSYVIRSNKSIELWRDSIKNILHPAGLVLFSELDAETELSEIPALQANVIEDSTIEDYFAIFADSTTFNCSNVTYSNSKFEIPITADFAFYINDKL